LSVALTRSERVPSDRANTNGNDDFPTDRASIVAISQGHGHCSGHLSRFSTAALWASQFLSSKP
jgi:hypothetical protein